MNHIGSNWHCIKIEICVNAAVGYKSENSFWNSVLWSFHCPTVGGHGITFLQSSKNGHTCSSIDSLIFTALQSQFKGGTFWQSRRI